MKQLRCGVALLVTAVSAAVIAVPAHATPTPQGHCDKARVTAWKNYVSCLDTVVAKDASCVSTSPCPPDFDASEVFAQCRHKYFKNWAAFQTKASLTTSTCALGLTNRFTDNGTTVTDNLSGLVWEKKTNDATVHDEGNQYTWSTGSPWLGNGTVFTTFLAGAVTGLNVAAFAGANDWRLPTMVELQSILLDFPCRGADGGPTCSCGSNPCLDGTFGPTQADNYWSATSYVPNRQTSPADPGAAWLVAFGIGEAGPGLNFKKTDAFYVRAVRGGL